jgi:hypothetical protein
MFSLLWVIVVGFLLFQVQYSYGFESGKDSNELAKILAKYWSWWSNSQEDQPEKNPRCSMGIDTLDSFVFLLNPFEVGDVSYNCSDSPIPKGYSMMFPILTAFCSQGDKGLYNKTYQEVRDCALNLDRGKIKGIVSIDDKVIVNITKDNGNGIEMKGILKNNLPQYDYYKEIFSNEFVNLLTTSNTTIPLNWEHPEEFEKGPIYYKAVEHCECVIIDTNDFVPGNHTLKYIVDSMGGKSSIVAADTGWKFRSTATYEIVTQ